MEIAETIIGMKSAQTHNLMQIAILKKSHEMQMDLINMLSEVARSAPPPGQGTRVDKSA